MLKYFPVVVALIAVSFLATFVLSCKSSSNRHLTGEEVMNSFASIQCAKIAECSGSFIDDEEDMCKAMSTSRFKSIPAFVEMMDKPTKWTKKTMLECEALVVQANCLQEEPKAPAVNKVCAIINTD